VGGARQQFYKTDQLTASPYFTSLAKTYSAQVGAGVTLACKVENLGNISTFIFFVVIFLSLAAKRHCTRKN
jgi:hypothetical protein